MATSVTECGNVKIVTQLIQQTDPQAASNVLGNISTTSELIPEQIQSLKNTLSKALGVVQIVLGATQISFGIALTVAQMDFKTLTVKSAIYFWIGILLLFSGSLLVEKEKRKHAWLMQASFIACLLVSVAALIAVILHATEIAQEIEKADACNAKAVEFLCKTRRKRLMLGLNSVFIILSILELSVAVTALVIGFKDSKEQLYQQMLL